MNEENINHYLKIIDQIEKVRTKNNINWMDILRIAISHAPTETRKVMKKINTEDRLISELFQKLSE